MLSFFQCRGSLTTILVTSQLAQELDPFIYLTIELKRQRNWSFQTFSGELFTEFIDYKFSLTKCSQLNDDEIKIQEIFRKPGRMVTYMELICTSLKLLTFLYYYTIVNDDGTFCPHLYLQYILRVYLFSHASLNVRVSPTLHLRDLGFRPF